MFRDWSPSVLCEPVAVPGSDLPIGANLKSAGEAEVPQKDSSVPTVTERQDSRAQIHTDRPTIVRV